MTAFASRHLGANAADVRQMLSAVGHRSLDELIDAAVPVAIHLRQPLAGLPTALSETEALAEIKAILSHNRLCKSYLGLGYYDCVTPPVIQRNILENPGWYTAYTPYQAEISQGRLEALLTFQTMVADLTGLDIANASLLDEATAAAEAMALCHRSHAGDHAEVFLVSDTCHPQTIAVVRTRAEPLGIRVVVGNHREFQLSDRVFGILVQYPATDGTIYEYSDVCAAAHQHQALVVCATDLLALTLLKPPAEFGADVAVGNSQRFGVPLGYGGPHAAFFATRDQYKRHLPGRLIGRSHDSQGRPAYRMALQTREQHIRREKATSNICTAQALPAILAAMYAVWHGPAGLQSIARRIHTLSSRLADHVDRVGDEPFFDTIRVRVGPPRRGGPNRNPGAATGAAATLPSPSLRGTSRLAAPMVELNARDFGDGTIGISLDETTTDTDVDALIARFGVAVTNRSHGAPVAAGAREFGTFGRTTSFLTAPVFQRYHTEHELLRYLKRLESRDLSLTTSMIPLGSCTMKLNATAEMMPLTWPEVGRLHPFVPVDQAAGYQTLFRQLESWLSEITGLAATSLQPNAGSAGEYAGLLAIRAWHRARGQPHRNVCLIPVSAHGTNPASAAMAGLAVVPVACDPQGSVDLADLRAKAGQHRDQLACLMVTYPSTHGVFEPGIREICQVVHDHGGQVYLDGANMNAQVGLCRPGDLGADVCHLNLHKTFCIPHGGGGPGVGPICVAEHLAPFLPSRTPVPGVSSILLHAFPSVGGPPVSGVPSEPLDTRDACPTVGPVAAAPQGSASILVIPWMYIRMMGAAGLTEATRHAILNANYIAHRLDRYFPVLYRGPGGLVAHECILDVRPWKQRAGIEVEDVAKRLIDFGFHAPTMSWPVAGTLMVEPTESESKAELDRFCDALIAIHGELAAIAAGDLDRENNPVKHAPHTAAVVSADQWTRPYSREQAAYPAPWLREHKFWPAVGRIDNVYGDRNLVCTCPNVE